jgi:predicted RNA binding protein YcfA (HicA-like mRNA interferase family)
MSQRERLIARLRARPPEADFHDVRLLLEEFGWREARKKGSHVIFIKDAAPSITVPTLSGRRVKRVYLARIGELLGLDA